MRDLRLDFFRGLAIYMIFVDHIIGDPLSKFTYRSLGFSDAAEIFVFISGLACGIVYSRTFVRHGFAAVMQATIKRAGRIYVFYVLSSVAVIALVCHDPRFMQAQELLGVSAHEPVADALWALLFVTPPRLSGLLILYIVLTLLIVPPLFLACGRYRSLILAISALAWLATQVLSSALLPITHYVYPNPIAWQFLFVIGALIGIKREKGEPLFKSPVHLRWAIAAAWIFVIGSLVYRVISARTGFNVETIRLDPGTWASMKDHLSPLRLVHILSVALLVSVYVRQDSPWLKWTFVSPIIMTGMRSLEMFSLSIVLTTLANIVVLVEDPSTTYRLVMDGIAFAVLALTAAMLAHHRHAMLRQRVRA